jgi:hypothetical protein
MTLTRKSILNEFIRLHQLYRDTFIEVFKGEEYTVIVYCDVNDSDEIKVFIDVDKLIVCVDEETVKYEGGLFI